VNTAMSFRVLSQQEISGLLDYVPGDEDIELNKCKNNAFKLAKKKLYTC